MPIVPSPAVLRAAEILQHFAQHPDDAFNVSEIARQVGIPRATCDSVLLALLDTGFVTRSDADRRYRLGPSNVIVGDAARSANAALSAAFGEASTLAAELGCCAAVAAAYADDAEVVEVFDLGPPFGFRVEVGQSIPLIPPLGGTIVAWAGEARIDRWLDRLAKTSSRARREEYRRALVAVRARRYSALALVGSGESFLDSLQSLFPPPQKRREAQQKRRDLIRQIIDSETIVGDFQPGDLFRVTQISAPVFNSQGDVAAEVFILGSISEISGAQLARLGAEVTAAADRATRKGGGVIP